MEDNKVSRVIHLILDNLLDFITFCVAAYLIIRNEIEPIPPEEISRFFSWILTILGLIAISGIWDRNRRMNRIEKKTEKLLAITQTTTESLLLRQFPENVQNEINNGVSNAKSILIIGTSLERTIDMHFHRLEQNLRNNGKIRIVVVNPESKAFEVAAKCYYRPRDLKIWRAQIQSTLNTLIDLKIETSGNLEIRVIDTFISQGGFFISPSTNDGKLFLWFYSYRTKGNSPKLILRPTDTYWYSHFVEYSETIWNTSKLWKR